MNKHTATPYHTAWVCHNAPIQFQTDLGTWWNCSSIGPEWRENAKYRIDPRWKHPGTLDDKPMYVDVQFAGTAKHYTYRCHDISVEKGDDVVVMSPSGLAVCRVINTHVVPRYQGTKKWIVCRVNSSKWAELTHADTQRENKKCDLRRKITNRLRTLTGNYEEMRKVAVGTDKTLRRYHRELEQLT